MRMKTKLLAALGFCLLAVNAMAQNVPIFKDQGGAKLTVSSGGTLLLTTGSILTVNDGVTVTMAADVTQTGNTVRAGQEYIMNAGGKPGSANGWLTTGGLVNLFNYTLPASEATTATLVFPVNGLKVGWTITGFSVRGQAESAGNTLELEGDLRKITATVGGNADASIGAIAGLKLTADTIIASVKTGLTEVVAADETYYVLLSGTTAANTDFDIMGITVTVTEN